MRSRVAGQVVAYRTVNLKPDTYNRLRAYRLKGRSFDEVVERLMERVPVPTIHRDLARTPASAGRASVLEFAEVKRPRNARAVPVMRNRATVPTKNSGIMRQAPPGRAARATSHSS